MLEQRLQQEHDLLLKFYPATTRNGLWFLIPGYAVAGDRGWNQSAVDVAFQAQGNHPAAAPYGFHVPIGILCNGKKAANYNEPSPARPPFTSSSGWGFFSWTVGDGVPWIPKADLVSGANLLNFARSIADRFREGGA